MSGEPWRWGALALVIGGVAGAVGGVVFLAADAVGAWLTVLALLVIGVGLIGLAAGFSGTGLREWARWCLLVAGALFVLEFLLDALADLGVRAVEGVGLVLPPLAALVLTIAAVMVLVDRAAPGVARWVLLLPAGWALLLALAALLGPLGSWWAVAIQDLLFAAAGGVYLATARSHGRASFAHA
jgi:hypothetical protein